MEPKSNAAAAQYICMSMVESERYGFVVETQMQSLREQLGIGTCSTT